MLGREFVQVCHEECLGFVWMCRADLLAWRHHQVVLNCWGWAGWAPLFNTLNNHCASTMEMKCASKVLLEACTEMHIETPLLGIGQLEMKKAPMRT